MSDWIACVSTRSLEKGCDYFESGCVRAVERRIDGWHATVSGGDDYVVFVPTSLDPYRAQCSCPHYAAGNICKHIAATFIAVERRLNMGVEGEDDEVSSESIEDIAMRADASALRDFIVRIVRHDDALEREFRATFGLADVKRAKQDLRKATTAIMHRHAFGGFVDWRGAMEFACDYSSAVESIMRPFFAAGDANALTELALARLVQLQRICIDDSDGFFTDALGDIVKHLDHAFMLGDCAQRQRLFSVLNGFLEENPGEDHGDIYWYERSTVEEFLADRFSQDARFAPRIIKLADERLDALLPASESGFDFRKHERIQWTRARLQAMAALGDSPDILQAYAEAEGLLEFADGVRLVADAYVAAGLPRAALALLRGNLDARESHHSICASDAPPRIVDCLVEIAGETCVKAELVELYTELFLMEPGHVVRDDDLVRWFDELHRLAGECEWDDMRARLFAEAPARTVNTCLAHEGSLEELFDHIMADGGADLRRFERVLSDVYPKPYIDLYIKDATSFMSHAKDRNSYRCVAASLAHAAGFPEGQIPAQKAAWAIRSEYPRRRALIDELRSAGFSV